MEQLLCRKLNANSEEVRCAYGCFSSMETAKMKASDCHPVLLPDILDGQEASSELHSSCDGGEKFGDNTDVVLEYFTPATRSTTESEIVTSNADSDGFYSTQTCRRQSVRAGDGNLGFMPPSLQVADGDCTHPANLKRHRAASASSEQRLQRRQEQQSQRQQQYFVTGAPTPATLLGEPVGRQEYAANRQGMLVEETQPLRCNKDTHEAQRQRQNKREDAALHVRPTLPFNGMSHEPNANTPSSWHYPAYVLWSAKEPTANAFIEKACGRHGTSQSQTPLQQVHRKTQPVPRRHAPVAVPAPSPEARAESSAAWVPTSRYERGMPSRILPREAVVLRGEGAVLQPTSAAAGTNKLSKGAKGDEHHVRPARRTILQFGECSRETLLVAPTVLQRSEAAPVCERDARRLPIGPGASERHLKGEESFFSALSFCTRESDASACPGITRVDTVSKQGITSPPTSALQHPPQQRTSSTGTCSTVSRRPVSEVHHQCGGHSAVATKHILINLAQCSEQGQDRSPNPAPAVAAYVLSPSHCPSTIFCKEAKQTRQHGVSLHSCKTENRLEKQYWDKAAESLREPTATRRTTAAPAPTAHAETSKLDQGSTVSPQPPKTHLWAGFLRKSIPPVRLSSSSAGSVSFSTQWTSPRGTAAAPPGCAAAVSTSTAWTPSSGTPLPSAGGGRTGPSVTSKCPAYMPWKAGSSLPSVPTDRTQQQHTQKQPVWPFSYYSHTSATRHSQGTPTDVRQHQSVETPKEHAQQQTQPSGSCYGRTELTLRWPLEALATQAFSEPSWLHLYEATRLEVIGVPRGGGATRLLKSAEILLCKSSTGAPCTAVGARVKEDRNSRQLIFLLPSREVVPVNHLRLHSCISQGSFGTVFRAHWKGKTVAVKQAHGCMTLEAMRSVVREINSFRSLDHPLILKYLGVCLDPNFLGIITEYLPGKSIFEALWESKILLTTATRLKLCRQLVEAVNYMHTEKRLVHRDLKTSNLILNGDDGLKLCDFGKTLPLAFHGRLRLEDNGGSPRYMAPECFVVGNLIDEKVDVWGLGCCIMEIMGGPIPFENIHSNEGLPKNGEFGMQMFECDGVLAVLFLSSSQRTEMQGSYVVQLKDTSLMALGTEYLGSHTRHAFYVAPENPEVDRWRSIFGYIQDGDVESFVKSFSDAASIRGNRGDAGHEAPASSHCLEVELFGYQSIVAHAAAFSKPCLEYLLSEKGGCDSNIRSSGAKDQTPLFNARGECIATLLAHGADPYARNVEGETAFTAAIKRRDYEQAVEYLQFGLNPNATDSVGYTALYIAAAQQESFEQEPFWDEFFERFCRRQSAEIPVLLNKRCYEGTTCLHAAAAAKKVVLVKKLLFWGADPSIEDDHGNAPKLEPEWKEGIEKNSWLGAPLALNEGRQQDSDLANSAFTAQSESGRGTREGANFPALYANTESRRDADLPHTDSSVSHQSQRASVKKRPEAFSTEESSSEEEDADENFTRSAQARILTAAREVVNRKIQAVDDEYTQLTAEAQRLNDEFQCLKNQNVNLEAKVASKLASFEDIPLLKAQKGNLNVVQYTSSLLLLNKVYDEYQKARKVAAEKEASAREQLEIRRAKLRDCQLAFRNFLFKVAKNSRMSRTSKPIPDAIIQQLLRLVEEKTVTICQSREASTALKHQLTVLQADASANHAQDQFHVMDFEQLKIENQALNEKIVERNEEIRKLQSIVISAVQFNTHWREKIHFLIHENAKATQELTKLDTELATQRELVNKSKKERDEYRAENDKLRQQTDMINSEVLTLDWEKRQQRKQELKFELSKLQRRFKELSLEKATLLRRMDNSEGAVTSGTLVDTNTSRRA